LQTLQAKVANWNHLVPIDLGSKGTCMIGGNVATNAGWVHRKSSLAKEWILIL
jgi:FAD/FMN-containing dehydrogenase